MEYELRKTGDRNIDIIWREKVFRRGKWRSGEKRVSTGTRDEKEAENVLHRWREGIKTELDVTNITTVREVLHEYTIELLNRNTSPKNMYRHYNCVKQLDSFFGDMPYQQVTRSLGREYIRVRSKTVKPQSASRELAIISAALNWCNTEEIIEWVPCKFPIHKSGVRDRFLSLDEINILIKHCDEYFLRNWVIIALSTAARSAAILELTADRVDLENGVIDFRNPLLTGRHKPRPVIKMPQQLRPYLEDAISTSQSGFVIERNGKPMMAIYPFFAKAVKNAGLDDVTPHILRHTCAVHMVKNGVPIYEVSKYLGHKSTRVTEDHYAKYTPDFMEKSSTVGSSLISNDSIRDLQIRSS